MAQVNSSQISSEQPTAAPAAAAPSHGLKAVPCAAVLEGQYRCVPAQEAAFQPPPHHHQQQQVGELAAVPCPAMAGWHQPLVLVGP